MKKHPELEYLITEEGDVYSPRKSLLRGKYLHQMKPCKTQVGYMDYLLTHNGTRVHRYAHRLVAETYLPNPHNLPEVNHKDKNKLNNHVSNLEWCTHRENIRHASKGGAWKALTKEQEREVLSLADKHTQSELALMYNVAQTTIGKVLLAQGIRTQHYLTDEELKELRASYLAGVSTQELVELTGKSYQSIYALVRNKRRSDPDYARELKIPIHSK